MNRHVLAAIALALCAGCAAPAAGPAGPPDGAAQPKVNRVVMAVPPPANLESNNPRNIGQTEMWQLVPMYEELIGIENETGKLVPQLATEWRIEGGGSALRFKLRKGVQFHGSHGEFTAKDVIHSWQDLIRDDATAGYQVVLIRRVVDRIETVNDHEVVMHLKTKDSDTLNTLSGAQGGFEIMSKAHFDAAGDPNLNTPPVAGTAPYQFKFRAQGSHVLYERVPYQHWRMKPDFPEFEFRWIKEASTRMAALLAREVHVTSLPNDLLPRAEQSGFKIVQGKVPALRTFLSIWCCYLDPQTGRYLYPESPLMDVRVRKALNKAINRQEQNRAFFSNKGQLIYGFNHVPSNDPAFNADWQRRFDLEYGYDPNAARSLLGQAGYGPGRPLKTNIFPTPLPQYSGAEDVVEAIASFWRQVGVDVSLVNMDGTQRQALSRGCKMDNHFSIIGTSGAPIVAYGYYNSSFVGNCGGYQHPETDALFDKIRQELDVEKHWPLWREIGDKSFDLHSNVPLFWLPAEAVLDPGIVADYPWPGSISGTWTHVEHIKAAR